MSKINLKQKWLSKKVLCTLFGHKLVVKRAITKNFNEFECTVCHTELTHDDKGRKTSLTPHLKEVNETLYNFHNRKNKIAI